MKLIVHLSVYKAGTSTTHFRSSKVVFLPCIRQLFAAPVAAATNSPEPSYAGAADTYAVVDIGGHQLIVEEGRWYTVNRLEVRELIHLHACI